MVLEGALAVAIFVSTFLLWQFVAILNYFGLIYLLGTETILTFSFYSVRLFDKFKIVLIPIQNFARLWNLLF